MTRGGGAGVRLQVSACDVVEFKDVEGSAPATFTVDHLNQV
jgi:hypothetical protein